MEDPDKDPKTTWKDTVFNTIGLIGIMAFLYFMLKFGLTK